jgi:hypothetical protein
LSFGPVLWTLPAALQLQPKLGPEESAISCLDTSWARTAGHLGHVLGREGSFALHSVSVHADPSSVVQDSNLAFVSRMHSSNGSPAQKEQCSSGVGWRQDQRLAASGGLVHGANHANHSPMMGTRIAELRSRHVDWNRPFQMATLSSHSSTRHGVKLAHKPFYPLALSFWWLPGRVPVFPK